MIKKIGPKDRTLLYLQHSNCHQPTRKRQNLGSNVSNVSKISYVSNVSNVSYLLRSLLLQITTISKAAFLHNVRFPSPFSLTEIFFIFANSYANADISTISFLTLSKSFKRKALQPKGEVGG